MKKLQIILVGTILIASPFMPAKAQNAELAAMPVLSTSKTPVKELGTEVMIQPKAGARGRKDFARRFTNASAVKWVAESNCISASFKEDGVNTSVIYDKKGRWIRDQKNYQEDKMPSDIRELVKRSEYFDSRIDFVNEIHEDRFLYYIVYLEDEKTFNEVIVFDGTITLYKTFNKA